MDQERLGDEREQPPGALLRDVERTCDGAGADANSYARRLLSACCISFEATDPAAPARRFHPPEFRARRNLGFGFLTVVMRHGADAPGVDVWMSAHHVGLDGVPLQDLLTTPRGAAIMSVVLVVAGGIREEVQRAFLLRRFEQWLGGPLVGVLVASIAFGAGHVIQGVDVAIVTGLLGLFWAVVYLRRRSIVAPVVSHSGFNLLQLGQFLIAGR